MRKPKVEKPITSLRYYSRVSVDERLMSLVNNYSSLYPGIPAGSLIRNLLIEELTERIDKIRSIKKAV